MTTGWLIGISATFLAVGLLGYHRTRGDDCAAELMVARRQLPLWLACLTLAATWIGGGYINGTAEAVYDREQGLVWCQAPWCYALSLMIGGLVFAGPMRRRGYRTMLDLFHERYGRKLAAFLYIPALVGDLFWTAAILAALGGTVSTMFDLDPSTVVILSASVVVIYTVCGGLWSVAFSDVLQLTCIVFGLVIGLPFAIEQCGGLSRMIGDYVQSMGPQARLMPPIEAFSGTAPWGWSWIDSALLLICGGIPWQVYFQRVLASRSPAAAVWMSLAAGGACLLVALAPMLLGMAGVCLDWSSIGATAPADPSLVLPYVLRYAVPPLVSLVGLTAIAAAVMSSADSSILSSSTMFVWNVVRPLASIDANSPWLILCLRLTIIVLGALAAVVALQVESVYRLWYFCADLVYVVLFPQLLMALFYRSATAAGAASGAATALILRGGIALFAYESLANTPAGQYVWGILEYIPWRTLTMLTSLVVIFIVSRWTVGARGATVTIDR